MDVQDNFSTQQQIDDFNRRMAGMAEHHGKALLLVMAERLKQDELKLLQTSRRTPSRLNRIRGWIVRQLIGFRPAMSVQKNPDLDNKIIIIDSCCDVAVDLTESEEEEYAKHVKLGN